MDALSLDSMSREEALAQLQLMRAYGVEDALDEEAPDRFALAPPASAQAPAIQAPSTQVRMDTARTAPAATSPAADTMAARTLAASATSLTELQALLDRFDGCPLKATANKTVFADGVPGSRLMLVGEAPGRDEDMAGLPFVGRSGQLLDRMLAAIGLDRSQVYIANIIPWRPPGNRTPTTQEVEVCRPFITRQIELAKPEIIVFVGGSSASAMLGTTDGIKKLRGRWMSYSVAGTDVPALAMLHPAYLLRQPLEKRLAWRDLLMLKAALEG